MKNIRKMKKSKNDKMKKKTVKWKKISPKDKLKK